MNKTVELNGNEAGIIIDALEDWAEKARHRGNMVVEHTHYKEAGFGALSDADVALVLRDKLDELFPPLEGSIGPDDELDIDNPNDI